LELLTLVTGGRPQRQFVACVATGYAGQSVRRQLPAIVDRISQVHPQGVRYAPPSPPVPGQRGRRRKKGERLPDLQRWADDPSRPWQRLVFDRYGLHATLQLKLQPALNYTAGKDRLLTIILTRDTTGKRPDPCFYCTRLDWSARQVLSASASRWALEVTFAGAKQVLGLEDPANRLPPAVRRTTPLALVLYSLIVLWFDMVGHLDVRLPQRPWYQRKREPSFQDLVTTLRRQSWEKKLAEGVTPCDLYGKWLATVAEWAAHVGRMKLQITPTVVLLRQAMAAAPMTADGMRQGCGRRSRCDVQQCKIVRCDNGGIQSRTAFRSTRQRGQTITHQMRGTTRKH